MISVLFFSSCPVKANVVVSALELLGPVCQVIRFGWRKKRHSGKGDKSCSASSTVWSSWGLYSLIQ